MRIEQLRYFAEVCRKKSMNSASENLHISQQTLSMAIKNLEQELEVVLLERTHLGVTLTSEGEKFLALAHEILFKLDSYKAKYGGKKNSLNGSFTIYATPAIHATFLPQLVSDFCKKHPNVNIEIIVQSPTSSYNELTTPKDNLRIMLANILYSDSGPVNEHLPPDDLIFHEIYTENYVAVVSINSILSDHKQLSIKTILKYPIIACGCSPKESNLSYQLLCQYGRPMICLTSDSPYVFMQAICDNIGIGFMPMLSLDNIYLQNFRSNIVPISVKEKIQSISGYILPKDYQANALTEEFIRFIKETLH